MLLTDRLMGWLKPLPLVPLLLVSGIYLTKTTGAAIAAVPPSLHSDKSPTRFSPSLPERLLVSAMPVTEDQRPHSRPLVQPALPIAPFPTFNSQQLDQQLQRYLRFINQFGQPDILIVGSSRALQGIDPIVLQQTLASRGYPNLKIFNLGVNGATAQLVDLLLNKLLTPDQLPRLLLWGDGVRAFNGGRIDTTYNRAIASPGYQLLTAGIRPLLIAEALPQSELPCTAFSVQRSSPIASNQPKYFSFVPPFDPTAKGQQGCWDVLKNLSQPASAASLDPTAIRLQEATGFQSRSEQFKPDAYFRRYPKVQGAYDADYRDFTLSGQQIDALHNILTLAKARGIPVVFVNLPLTKIYLDPIRTAYEEQFRMYLQLFARSQLVTVHDLSQRWLTQNDYFTDPSHLNRDGAAAVAAHVGNVLIPISTRH